MDVFRQRALLFSCDAAGDHRSPSKWCTLAPNDDGFVAPPNATGQARPFYCAHLCAVQLAGGTVAESRWEPSTLLPDMAHLKREIEKGVKMVVITTPGELWLGCPRRLS